MEVDQAVDAVRSLEAIEYGELKAKRMRDRLETRDVARGRELEGYADEVLARCSEITEAIVLPRVLRIAAMRIEIANRGGSYSARHLSGRNVVGRAVRDVEREREEPEREPIMHRVSRSR